MKIAGWTGCGPYNKMPLHSFTAGGTIKFIETEVYSGTWGERGGSSIFGPGTVKCGTSFAAPDRLDSQECFIKMIGAGGGGGKYE